MRVLLVSMPYGALDRPALGISLLKARLSEFGIACDIQYLNVRFAELTGSEEYRWVSSELPYTAFAGDWTFTASLYGERPESDRGYINEILKKTWVIDNYSIIRLLRIRKLVGSFLDYCMNSVSWDKYDVVGFTSTFEQNIASLSLAKRIKAKYPGLAIVFGGANWEGEMGVELHKSFTYIDYVCSGEADNSFPELVLRLRDQIKIDETNNPIKGIVLRSQGKTVFTGQASPIKNLDSLPIPDFSDYFHTINRSNVMNSVSPMLLCETSRGCWWGAKSHCTFCGLNGSDMAFRSKSPARALKEIIYLTQQWQTKFIEVVDNILDMKYFDTLLVDLADKKLGLRLYYEVKANLSRRHIEGLAAAGIHRIQPGIESMNDRILKLMRKGTTALRNIQLLKWCKEYGVEVDWNILYGFPGEMREDYSEMLRLLESIRFLGSPSGCGPLRLDRFSPYHREPSSFGLTDVHPLAIYRYLYPFDQERLSRIAYYFDFTYKPELDPNGCAQEVIAFIDAWRSNPETGSLLSIIDSNDTLTLLDSRSYRYGSVFSLQDPEKSIYEFCDEIQSLQAINKFLAQKFPSKQFDVDRLIGFLDSLVDNQLMVTDGAHYLSLSIPMRRPINLASIDFVANNG